MDNELDTSLDLPIESQPDEAMEMHKTIQLSGMYKNWFLDYASYVILERAVPEVLDGLKPVQRRILHSMYELEDGRYNKVANVIGNTMKYHPHGDASIGDAMVQLGQKDLLIDTQGNWGNILTGDSAAAPRYIEARLSKFALDVAFNPKTTEWKASYDGRNKEPVVLPMKFPLLLAQGVEGIAVGLASKLLPHNFVELINASIAILKGQEFQILPDFPTGGLADFTRYNDGLRGGKVRIRARINQLDKKTLVITEIPFGTTTGNLIDSIIKASDKGKIKIRKIDDNTAAHVEILVHLQAGVSPDQTIDALYAFTDCERSESPNACVIINEKPEFIGVSEILKICTRQTLEVLKLELQIRLHELNERMFFSSLLKIFIQEGMYKHPSYENSGNFELICQALDTLFEPFFPVFSRPIEADDYKRLIERPMSSITRFDVKKADDLMAQLQSEIKEIEFHLANLIEYAIAYFEEIKKKYGAKRGRKTEIRSFESIEATAVAATNVKLYVNRAEGFAGTGLKKEEYLCDCSDLDDIIAFRADGTCVVVKVAEKVFVGKDIIYINVFKKNDDRTIYNMAYQDGRLGAVYVKRFSVTGVTREKEYVLTKGAKGSEVLYFTANPNGESEIVRVQLKAKPRLKKLQFDFDFSTLAIKGRASQGNILTRNAVKKIVQVEKGVSTLSARNIWFDDVVFRLNVEQRGSLLGAFKEHDKILIVSQSGYYRFSNFDLGNRFEEDIVLIEKYSPSRPLTAVYFNETKKAFFVKRFQIEDTDKRITFIPEDESCRLEMVTSDYRPVLQVNFSKKAKPLTEDQTVDIENFIELMGVKAKGKRVVAGMVEKLSWNEPLPYEEEIPAEEEFEDLENADQPDEPLSLEDLIDPEEIPDFPDDDDAAKGIQTTLF